MTNIHNLAQKIVDDTINSSQFMMGLDVDFLLVKELHRLFPLFELKKWTTYITLDWSPDDWCYHAKGTAYFEKELLRLYPEVLI